jgi:hypothetical protein
MSKSSNLFQKSKVYLMQEQVYNYTYQETNISVIKDLA